MKALLLPLSFVVSIFAQDGFHDLITIDQNGNGNECIATNEQSEGLNISNIVQDGNYNGTAFDMTGDGVKDPTMIERTAPNCEAYIEEHGNYNSAYIQQNFDANTIGNIYQDGNHNLAILKQGYCTIGSLIQERSWNTIDANQVCSDASLTGTQTGNRNSLILEQKFDSKLDASQNGNNNEATVYIDYFSTGRVVQDGDNNYAYQEEGPDCTGEIQQLSDGNFASQVLQTLSGWGENFAQILQTGGINNYAVQFQSGNGLSSIITQCGSNNKAESYQTDEIY